MTLNSNSLPTKMGLLSKDALNGIASYKYKSGAYTMLDNAMNSYWSYVVEFLPLWLAPNMGNKYLHKFLKFLSIY